MASLGSFERRLEELEDRLNVRRAPWNDPDSRPPPDYWRIARLPTRTPGETAFLEECDERRGAWRKRWAKELQDWSRRHPIDLNETLIPRLAAVLQGRLETPVEEPDGALTGMLVPALAGPQNPEPLGNAEPLPPTRPRGEGWEVERDVLRGFRDYGPEDGPPHRFEPDPV
jgi:hypothetical protein